MKPFPRGARAVISITMTLNEAYAAAVEAGTVIPDPAQLAVMDDLERVRAELAVPVKRGLFRKKPDPVRGLYLWGGVGRGKSMLMDMLYDMVDVPKERSHFHAFMQWVHSEMNNARKRGVDDAIKPVAEDLAARVRFLAFDEMQISDITDAMIVGRLFEKLFEAGVTVVTTSNRVPDELYKNGLNRQLFLPFIALIKEKLHVRELTSETDHRQGRLAGEQMYFAPNSEEASAALREIWQDFSQGCAEPLVLKVKSRDVEIPGFFNGVARASFYDLCAKPLGAADYLALAEAVRVLILEDIPRLSRHNFNEAKRFVTLIDALYEAKVRLICSAADVPERLYVEGEGAFEFERTASRLQEMQSADWGTDA